MTCEGIIAQPTNAIIYDLAAVHGGVDDSFAGFGRVQGPPVGGVVVNGRPASPSAGGYAAQAEGCRPPRRCGCSARHRARHARHVWQSPASLRAAPVGSRDAPEWFERDSIWLQRQLGVLSQPRQPGRGADRDADRAIVLQRLGIVWVLLALSYH